MLVWDVICPDIFTPSYTSMEVEVVLAGQRMKTLIYQTISTILFFISIRKELSGGLLSLSKTEISLLNYHGKPGRQ